MNENFPRIISHLRKESGVNQKTVAEHLQISQSLLSHYEKGKRECGLDFLVKIAEYYNVSCDYLLGRTLDRQGSALTLEEASKIANSRSEKGENYTGNTILSVFNKKLIFNSLSVIYDILLRIDNKRLTKALSMYLMLPIYKVFRTLFSIDDTNHQTAFSLNKERYKGYCDASMSLAYSDAKHTIYKKNSKVKGVEISSKQLEEDYPDSYSYLLNLIQHSERFIDSKTGK